MKLTPLMPTEGLWENVFGFYPYELEIAEAKGITITDTEGKEYIDASGGPMVQSIAHGDERVARAIADQLEKYAYAHPSFASRTRAEFCNEVASVMPDGLNATYVACGGSEANEVAIKIAYQYHKVQGNTRKRKLIGAFDSYHGMTISTAAASGNPSWNQFFDGLHPDWTAHFDQYSEYLRPEDIGENDWAVQCARRLEQCIHYQGADTVSAVMLMSFGGGPEYGLVAPDAYWQEIRRICDRYDVLLIVDEVVSGFGRMGTWFACQKMGITPDIITMAKGCVAGYLPLAAVTVSDDISKTIRESGPLMHGFTYSGHPVSCAAGTAVVQAIKEDGLVEHSARLSGKFFALGKQLLSHPTVADVRGGGLLMAIELTAGKPGTREFFPADKNADHALQTLALKNHLAIYGGLQGPGAPSARQRGSILRLCPPMVITENELVEMMRRLDITLSEWEKEMGVVSLDPGDK